MGSPRIKDRVLQYLTERPGTLVWRNDIASDLGLTEHQVGAAMGTLIRTNTGTARFHIEVVEYGRAWRWSPKPLYEPRGNEAVTGRMGSYAARDLVPVSTAVADRATAVVVPSLPAATASRRLYEELAALPDGRALVRSETGDLYWLSRFEASAVG